MKPMGFTLDCFGDDSAYCEKCIWRECDPVCRILRPAARAHRNTRIYVSIGDMIIRVIIFVYAYTGENIDCREVRIARDSGEQLKLLNLMVNDCEMLDEGYRRVR